MFASRISIEHREFLSSAQVLMWDSDQSMVLTTLELIGFIATLWKQKSIATLRVRLANAAPSQCYVENRAPQ